MDLAADAEDCVPTLSGPLACMERLALGPVRRARNPRRRTLSESRAWERAQGTDRENYGNDALHHNTSRDGLSCDLAILHSVRKVTIAGAKGATPRLTSAPPRSRGGHSGSIPVSGPDRLSSQD